MSQYIAGIDSSMMGMSQGLPDTYRQSLMVEEYGARKIKVVDMTAVESALQYLGQATLELDQWWYDFQKKLAIVDDNGKMREFVINKAIIDARTRRIVGVTNSIRQIKFDVHLIVGSTLPKNKYAVLELYLGLFDRGLVDEETVLRQTDVLDVDTVLEKISRIRQAMSAIEDLQDQQKRMGTIINSLENQLIQAKIKEGSREQLLVEQLRSLETQMAQRLAKAQIEITARAAIDQMKRQEQIQALIGQNQIKNLVAVSKANLAAQNAKQTAPSATD